MALEKLTVTAPVVIGQQAQKSISPSTNLPADRLKSAKSLADQLLGRYPDFSRATREYIFGMTEFLATVTEAEWALLSHPRTGITATCKYLPTPADLSAFLAAKSVCATSAPPSAYFRNRVEIDPPQPPADRRKAQVLNELGYDPQDRRGVYTPSPEDISAAKAAIDRLDEAAELGEPLPLKTPPRPASNELKRLLIEQGHGHLLERPIA